MGSMEHSEHLCRRILPCVPEFILLRRPISHGAAALPALIPLIGLANLQWREWESCGERLSNQPLPAFSQTSCSEYLTSPYSARV